jgi:hypothetical protein
MAVEERTAAEAAIVNAVLDHFEGWFDGDAGRMEPPCIRTSPSVRSRRTA